MTTDTEHTTREIDWNYLVVPDDTVFVYATDGDTVITLSPGGGNTRLPVVYDEDGDQFKRVAMEFADGTIVRRPGYDDVDLPEWGEDD
jgi:hypothetical protein